MTDLTSGRDTRGVLRLSLKTGVGAAALLLALFLASPAMAKTAGPLAPWAMFGQSFGIILREGVEALLLCTALSAAVLKGGASGDARAIWVGAVAALVASVATAFLVERVFHLAPAGREAIEGVTMLLAAAVLFYVSYWLLSKLEIARWMGYLKDKVGGARSQRALAGVAFLAVYREGVETVLFYQALSGVGDSLPIWAGLAAGVVALAGVGVALLRFGLRLPLRSLFAITGGLLYYLAVVFAGQGMHELQEAGWMTTMPLSGVPRVGFLGIYPTAETVAVQALLVVLAIAAGGVIWRRRSRAALPPADRGAALRRAAAPEEPAGRR